MGSSRLGAQQSRHLQSSAGAAANGYQRQRSGEQQRRGYGAEAVTLLEEAGQTVLVGGRGAGQCRWHRWQAEGLDTEGLDFGDGMF